MREILFRGKRVDNGEWIYGDVIQFPMHGIVRIIEQNSDNDGSYGDSEIDCDTLGQFTGLTDKNGKKIFEGDIIRQKGFLNNYYTSVWYASGRFLVKDYETLLPTELGGISRYKIEVIGNIHDNPELQIDNAVKKYCDYLKSETYDFCNRIENGEVSE